MIKVNILEDNEMQIASCNNTYRPNSSLFFSKDRDILRINNHFQFLSSL